MKDQFLNRVDKKLYSKAEVYSNVWVCHTCLKKTYFGEPCKNPYCTSVKRKPTKRELLEQWLDDEQ